MDGPSALMGPLGRSDGRRGRARRRAAGASLGMLAALGCYAIPPRLPEDYIGSAPPEGWPPPAAYSCDPFAPENRWFHRLYGGRTAGGEPIAPSPSAALAPGAPLGDVDLAEIAALSEEMLGTIEAMARGEPLAPRGSRKPGVAWEVLAADARTAAARLAARGPEPGVQAALHESLVRILDELARRAAGDAPAGLATPSPLRLPPPLRADGWSLEPGPVPSPHEATPIDPRERSRRRAVDGRRALILGRAPAGAGQESGRHVPATECWVLEEGGARASVWLFDRSRALRCGEHGAGTAALFSPNVEDPWVEDDGEGGAGATCAGCHHPG